MATGAGSGTPATAAELTAEITKVRRMVNEPSETDYTDEVIQGYIEDYPLLDERGEEPYTWDTSTSPPTMDDNDDWVATYDLNAAAADLWGEKAAVVAEDFDFLADGGSFKRSQVLTQYGERERYYRSRRAPRTIRAVMWPQPGSVESGIGNLPEEE